MTDEELAELVSTLRRVGTDLDDIEVKRGRDKMPASLVETLSSFANSSGGGVIILGLDESMGFEASGVADPATMQSKIMGLCADSMQPPLRPLIESHIVDGQTLLTIEVPEIDAGHKPCFYKGSGQLNGSYRRVGDGDHRMTPYEVHQFLAARGQPEDDTVVVPHATVEDLDRSAVQNLLAMVRVSKPSCVDSDDNVALRMLRVLADDPDSGDLRPTRAGILALGRYPQQFFPQLNITFVHYPAISGSTAEIRFVDNRSIDGSIPQMLTVAMQALRANMLRRGVIRGPGREDSYEYPEEALREAIVNALVHRDYSPMALGSQVQIEMYPDRLVIRNPGGLFGPVTADRLGQPGVASSRNALLLKLLESVTLPEDRRPICENRASGIPAILRATKAAGLTPPRFADDVASFTVTFPNHTLMSPETLQWLESLGEKGLSDSQAQALIMMQEGEELTNASYRSTLLVDSRVATAELGDLVRRGLVACEGTRRWASYRLAARLTDRVDGVLLRPQDEPLLELLGAGLTPTRSELAARLQVPDRTVLDRLNRLRKAQPPLVERLGTVRSRDTRYRITAAGEAALVQRNYNAVEAE